MGIVRQHPQFNPRNAVHPWQVQAGRMFTKDVGLYPARFERALSNVCFDWVRIGSHCYEI